MLHWPTTSNNNITFIKPGKLRLHKNFGLEAKSNAKILASKPKQEKWSQDQYYEADDEAKTGIHIQDSMLQDPDQKQDLEITPKEHYAQTKSLYCETQKTQHGVILQHNVNVNCHCKDLLHCRKAKGEINFPFILHKVA